MNAKGIPGVTKSHWHCAIKLILSKTEIFFTFLTESVQTYKPSIFWIDAAYL